MPTYDLRCAACDHQFEVFRQGFLRDRDRICPDCGAEAKQVITGFVTARPARAAAPAAGGGHAHHGGCGCGGH